MSIDSLSRYIDDLLNAEEPDARSYVAGLPGGGRELLPLLATARAVHIALRSIEVDRERANQSQERARKTLNEVLNSHEGPGRK
ncbi:MAG: hypothetical protein ACE5O2_10290 [Armatimonadota bacterium]